MAKGMGAGEGGIEDTVLMGGRGRTDSEHREASLGVGPARVVCAV